LPVGEPLGERAVRGGQVGDPLVYLARRLSCGRGEVGALGFGGGFGFGFGGADAADSAAVLALRMELDRVDQFADFDPRRDYALTLAAGELSEVERNAAALAAPAARGDDIDLDLP